MKQNDTYKIGLALLGIFGLMCASCSSEMEQPDKREKTELKMVLGPSDFNGVTVSQTRALPDGYLSYDNLYTTSTVPNYANIIGFLTKTGDESLTPPNLPLNEVFLYREGATRHEWSARIEVQSYPYYVYGFMPKEDAGSVTIAPNPTYAEGAILNIYGLKSITGSDVCAIVGVKGHGNNTDPIADVGIQLGNFGYSLNDGKYLYLLVDHLYASLKFQLAVSAQYSDLRTIKIKKMTLEPYRADPSASVLQTVNVTATLTANNTGDDPLTTAVTIANGASGTSYQPAVLFETENNENPAVLTTTASDNSFRAYFAPGKVGRFILETTYDVYDTNDNLVRENQTARNALLPGVTLARGQDYTFTLTVDPTYLHVLSEPDLDNPTFTLN